MKDDEKVETKIDYPITTAVLQAALTRCVAKIDVVAPELNERDGQLGDGDLGTTLSRCAANVRVALPGLPDDLGLALQMCAMACARASGSSFGTLLSVAFLAMAKSCVGRTRMDWEELPILLAQAQAQMSHRGGAQLEDKTVLDALHAAHSAMLGLTDPIEQGRVARMAVASVIACMRGQPNKIGRARMFAERSVGLDDPGMIAFAHLLDAASAA